MDHPVIAIIGAGLAGAKAAEGARGAGFQGRVILIGDEDHLPYERPPLSKNVLRGDQDPLVTLVHREEFYEDNDIQLVRDQPTALDVDNRLITVGQNDPIHFDAAVVCTGSEPRRLNGPDQDLEGVHYLRSIDDSLRLQNAIRSARRVAVVGAGWIGSEVAASARQMGAEVVIIEPAAVPLSNVFGEEVGHVFERLHQDHGVELRMGSEATQLRGSGHVEAVVLDDGRTETADVVIIGIGISPRVAMAEEAGLKIDNGILVDETLQTSVPGIFAAGDVANAFHPFYQEHIRVEHWANAQHQGLLAGANVATLLSNGPLEVYSRLPYFFSDQYDLGLEYVGFHHPGDSLVIRGDTHEPAFIAFWLRDGIVTAAMNVNLWDVAADLTAIVEGRQRIEPKLLGDPGTPLSDLHEAGLTLREQ